MVSTRGHPRGDFPANESSPTKRASRTSASPAPTSSPDLDSSPSFLKSLARRAVSNTNASPSGVNDTTWCHTASNITILWLTVSIPLVLWDSLYILLRPHTMSGGALQWPLWKPYEIYASIDHVYGWPGWDRKDGFGGAQGALNAVEVVLYGLYAMIIYNHGVSAAGGTGLQLGEGVGAWFAGGRKVRGPTGNRALIIGFAAAVMTLSKTVLYYFNEYYSDFGNIRHNDWLTILFFYGVMNGLWVIFPAYMTVVFGTDILQGLDIAAASSSKKRS
ncbi:uncharacterized protein K460DRAFT_367993 [Cucurbitaria berberidis CBS 394.84]|uniref:Cholestenol delta-isomerase n=1 Tax=Cucurbitaria berberidis CBS 394.84 TaxID=1168544 RepID=A0A9P4GCL1_9PLEO|nr:uncharacterized protein K460DRAFT_367993 [Cucurbitaria berberidis CBS 394.84]KAF1843061.1 hypothetical protein K460DRAFT_367993 [Cucurbitaria berberidis CBS 394.84]